LVGELTVYIVYILVKFLFEDGTEEIFYDCSVQVKKVCLGGAACEDYWALCLGTMADGEHSRFKLHGDHAFAKYGGRDQMNLTNGKKFTWMFLDFKIDKITVWKRPISKTFEEELHENETDRLEGNKLYYEKKFPQALKIYRKCLLRLQSMKFDVFDEKVLRDKKNQLHVNIVSTLLANKEFSSCIRDVNEIFSRFEEFHYSEPKLESKLYRIRSKAYSSNGNFDMAEDDLKRAIKLDDSLENAKAMEILESKMKSEGSRFKKMIYSPPASDYEVVYDKMRADKVRQYQCAVIASEELRNLDPNISTEKVMDIVGFLQVGERIELVAATLGTIMKETEIAGFFTKLMDRATQLEQEGDLDEGE
jgi:tetratricopeptide (TPR) repeat protein